jgi:hypothetical protein
VVALMAADSGHEPADVATASQNATSSRPRHDRGVVLFAVTPVSQP